MANKSKSLDDCIEYRRLKGLAQRTMKDEARDHWQNFCKSLTRSTKLGTVWKSLNLWTGSKLLVILLTWLKTVTLFETTTAKANLFARQFAKVSSDENYSDKLKKYKTFIETNHNDWFENDLAGDDKTRIINEPFTPHELRSTISQCKNTLRPAKIASFMKCFSIFRKAATKVLLKLYNEWHMVKREITR